MTVETERDLVALMRIGQIVGQTLRLMEENTRPGVTTQELDDIGATYLKRHRARPAPHLTYNSYPAANCISINDEACHGLPGSRVIRDGDLVKIDVSAELDGYFADTNATVVVGQTTPKRQRLVGCTREAMERAIDAVSVGKPLNEIGRVAEMTVRQSGFSIIRELPGHGVGRALHEEPSVPNHYIHQLKQRLHKGLVITIEPHVAMGKGSIYTDKDGWTVRTRDHSPVASFEHTVVITHGKPMVITAI